MRAEVHGGEEQVHPSTRFETGSQVLLGSWHDRLSETDVMVGEEQVPAEGPRHSLRPG
jgi:hypothetical protein